MVGDKQHSMRLSDMLNYTTVHTLSYLNIAHSRSNGASRPCQQNTWTIYFSHFVSNRGGFSRSRRDFYTGQLNLLQLFRLIVSETAVKWHRILIILNLSYDFSLKKYVRNADDQHGVQIDILERAKQGEMRGKLGARTIAQPFQWQGIETQFECKPICITN